MAKEQSKINSPTTVKLVGDMIDGCYRELKHARENGKNVAWVNGPPAWVVVRAMDILYLHGEAYGAANAARRIDKELKDVAYAEGFMPDACSYSRITMGGAIFAERGIPQSLPHPEMIMPKPDFVLTVNRSCSTETNWLDAMCRFFKVPGFLVDMPYVFRDSDLDRLTADVSRQFREAVVFIEKTTGRPYDWKRLKQMVALLKEAATLRMDSIRLCRNRPAPASFFDWAISLGTLNYLAGLPQSVDYFRKLKDEITERVKSKTGAIANEKYRIMFDGVMCWPKIGKLANKLASMDACAIDGRYTHYSFYDEPERLDPDRPLESIADALVRAAPNRTPEWQAEKMIDVCREFELDGILVHAPRTCRAHQRPQHAIMEAASKAGIPFAVYEGDHGDADLVNDAQADTAVSSLIEMIAARKR